MLFIVAGAFAGGLERIVSDRVGKRGLGFGAEVRSKAEIDTQDHFAEVMPEDLIKFGLIPPEFIGRLPVVASVTNLDKESLVTILSEPKNALVKQYSRLFEMDGVELEFTPPTPSTRSPTRRSIAAPVPAVFAPSWRKSCCR